MYDYNYTLAASIGFEAAMADTNRLHEGPMTTTTCTTRYFNTTYSTTVTEVSFGSDNGVRGVDSDGDGDYDHAGDGDGESM